MQCSLNTVTNKPVWKYCFFYICLGKKDFVSWTFEIGGCKWFSSFLCCLLFLFPSVFLLLFYLVSSLLNSWMFTVEKCCKDVNMICRISLLSVLCFLLLLFHLVLLFCVFCLSSFFLLPSSLLPDQ